jgi:glutamine---fructose-6-phosphate transaminase (isomerizing)
MSWLATELREQPEALRRLLDRQATAARDAARLFRRRDVRYVLIASRGSSGNVARYAQYLLGRAHRVPVIFATPSLYTIYGPPPRLVGGVMIGISQSGASPDVVAVLAEAREQGRPTLAITNDVDSPLARSRPECRRLSPLTAVAPGQVTAMRLASLRGLDLDRPAGLRKVTRTR